jgi:hypothetical protein
VGEERGCGGGDERGLSGEEERGIDAYGEETESMSSWSGMATGDGQDGWKWNVRDASNVRNVEMLRDMKGPGRAVHVALGGLCGAFGRGIRTEADIVMREWRMI